ncbi:metalloregulator ArsR/SmtB family transcription factor [uncultured Pseudokineococcus sp.]|uniref:metalloregulator ArsR/SmtB family transcription factor n=1 Tax=uncultured Pseudokineococcus sp. TaxID=1642928 RepID=UPI00261F12D3|nr:metalloregulator ArsR/SmtB family transcription factor [uncultured Pseudokineococcus sp.]
MTTAPETCDLLCMDLPHAEAVREVLPGVEELTSAAALARALADPTRLKVAAALAAGGAMCGCDLAWVTALAPNLVSHHARLLRASGLATSKREGKLVKYQLTPIGRVLLQAVLGPATPHELPLTPADASGQEEPVLATGAV